MLSISATLDWHTSHPGAVIGLLELSGVVNIASSPRLDARKREIESHLRERYKGFTRPDFLALPVMAAYDNYYKRFNKTYHVQLQLESIVLHGKNLPSCVSSGGLQFHGRIGHTGADCRSRYRQIEATHRQLMYPGKEIRSCK